MPNLSNTQSILSVRSQLNEQMLAWLGYVRDYPDHEAIPGRAFGLPPYYDAELKRIPSKLYISPLVEKQVPKLKLKRDDGGDRRSPSGFDRPQLRSISDVTADASPESPPENGTIRPSSGEPNTKPVTVAWDNECRQAPPGWRALITGAPGQGKSWLAQMTASQIASQARHRLESRTHLPDDLTLPVCLRADDLLETCYQEAGSNDFGGMHIRRAVTKLLNRVTSFEISHFAHHVGSHIHEDRFWLFLDALDEVPDNQHNQQRLRYFFQAIADWNTRVLVTSRAYAQRRFEVAAGHLFQKQAVYKLAALHPRDAQAFLDRWFNPEAPRPEQDLHALLRKPAYREIARSPQLLTLLCCVASTEGGQLPIGRLITHTDIYTAIFEALFMNAASHGTESEERHSFEDVSHELELIARAMMSKSASSPKLKHRKLRELIACTTEIRPEHEPHIKSRLALYKDLRILCPTTHSSASDWQFIHKEFASYFAGSALASQHNAAALPPYDALDDLTPADSLKAKQIEGYLARRVWDPEWERVSKFFVGKSHRIAGFFKSLRSDAVIDQSKKLIGTDRFRYRLFVAARLLSEIPQPQAACKIALETSEEIYCCISDTLKYLSNEIKHCNHNWSGIAVDALNSLTSSPTHFDPALLAPLEHALKEWDDSEASNLSAEMLAQIAQYADPEIQQRVIAALVNTPKSHRDSRRSWYIFKALGSLTQNAERQVKLHILEMLEYELGHDLENDSSSAAGWAAVALGAIAQSVDLITQKRVIETLGRAMKNYDDSLGMGSVTDAMTAIAQYAVPKIQLRIIEILEYAVTESYDYQAGYQAAVALGVIAEYVEPEVQLRIIKVLGNTIIYHHGSLLFDDTVDALKTIAEHTNPEVRFRVIETLEYAIKNYHDNWNARIEIIWTLWAIADYTDPDTRQYLIRILENTIKETHDLITENAPAIVLTAILLRVPRQQGAIGIIEQTLKDQKNKEGRDILEILLGNTVDIETQERVTETIQQAFKSLRVAEAGLRKEIIQSTAVQRLEPKTRKRIDEALDFAALVKKISQIVENPFTSHALLTIAQDLDSENQLRIIDSLYHVFIEDYSLIVKDYFIIGLGNSARHVKPENQQHIIEILEDIIRHHYESWLSADACEALGVIAQHANNSMQRKSITILENAINTHHASLASHAAAKVIDKLMYQEQGLRILQSPDSYSLITFPSPDDLIIRLNQS